MFPANVAPAPSPGPHARAGATRCATLALEVPIVAVTRLRGKTARERGDDWEGVTVQRVRLQRAITGERRGQTASIQRRIGAERMIEEELHDVRADS